MPAHASEADQIDALKAENEALAAEIAALKRALGLDKVEEAAERKRVQAIFQLYDTDGSGFIEQGEFQGLAAHCGLVLAPDALKKVWTNSSSRIFTATR